jgi:PAS domain S-box-containing protein
MKNLSLFYKIVVPVVLLGLVMSFFSIEYINSAVKQNIQKEVDEKLENRLDHLQDYIESEFKLLFYIYGTSAQLYEKQEALSKKETINLLRKDHKKTSDIAYLVIDESFVQITPKGINEALIYAIATQEIKDITVDDIHYKIGTANFKAWDWKIIYLLDTSKFEALVEKNEMLIFGAVAIMLFVIMMTLLFVFSRYISKPTAKFLKHFKQVTNGNFELLHEEFGTKELDYMVSYINKMTRAIELREQQSKQLLSETVKNERYVKDILDSQSNIIVVNDYEVIQEANKAFFKLFPQYPTLEEFKENHRCICEFFLHEEGYLYDFPDKNWIEYVLERSSEIHKVKIKVADVVNIFAVDVVESTSFDRVIISMTNITELEKSNSLLEEYKKAVDASAIVSKTDLSGRITYVNERFLNISGYSKEELIGHAHNIVRSPKSSSETFAKMWETIQSGKIWSGELENRAKDGHSYFVASTIVPLKDQNGKTVEYLALRYDITELVNAKISALKAEQAKGLFLANMSHEIRTPLNAIIGFTKILSNFSLQEKAANYIKIIDQSAQNLLGIINDILDISKIESGNLSLEKVEFNFFSELDGVINLFSVRAHEKSLNLISFIDPKIPQSVIGDPLRLKQVISNLISNAIKFTQEGGFVSFRAELISRMKDSCKVHFEVKDSGIGINKEKQLAIFDAFSQADNSISREFGGTGLGLSISLKILEAMGSKIELESESGKGSTFSFNVIFDTQKSSISNLEKFHKVKTGIVEIGKIDSLQYPILKEYLEIITTTEIIHSTNQIEDMLEQDILFLDESSFDHNIVSLGDKHCKIVILTKNKKEFTHTLPTNATVLEMPLNASILFNLLLEVIDEKSIFFEDKKSDSVAQFSGKVLVAEDHEINQQLIATLLDMRGVEYDFANNGIEAVAMFEKNVYDLILMDINMPEKNGMEASVDILEIERQQDKKHTPIVALTANAIEDDKQRVLALGIDGYLLKPIDEKALDSTLTSYLKVIEGDDVPQEFCVYDPKEASVQMKIPEVVLQKIINNFCKNIDKDVESLKVAIYKKDFEAVVQSAHKIKGAAVNLRMETLGKITSKIEQDAKNQNDITFQKDFEDLQRAVMQILSHCS